MPQDSPSQHGSDSNSPRSFSDDLDAKLEAEIEAALGDMNLEDMIEMAERPKESARGDRPRAKTGVVVGIHREDVMVEFGPKSQGVCPKSDFDNPPTIGERYEFMITRFDKKEGLLLLSRSGVYRKAEWDSLDVGQSIEATCTGTNKGGIELDVAKHKAFMPAGQVDIRHIDDLSVFVGEKMACEIIELDRRRGRIILSRRKTMEAERAEQSRTLLEELKQGDQRSAEIRSLQHYGAFADIGGIDGLIHISDICHDRIKHPSERISVGEKVQVQVLKIDLSNDPPRIGLGMKQCMADPYHEHAAKISEGDTVSGRVTKLMPFGAFVELAPGVEGLVHISQLAEGRVHNVGSIVKVNEVITVKVLDVDPKTRRISLSLLALKEERESEIVRPDDPALRKLKARFGGELKGGIG